MQGRKYVYTYFLPCVTVWCERKRYYRMNTATLTLFTALNLPAFWPNTSGWARPNPEGDIVATLKPIPETRVIQATWGLLTAVGGKHHHQVTAMDNGKGQIDEYPNDQFLNDFRFIRKLSKGEDPRADHLFAIYGDNTEVVLAQKTAPVYVLGKTKRPGLFVTSESSKDKPLEFGEFAVVVQNLARTRTWVVAQNDFAKLYEGEGNIYRGSPPQD